MTQHIALYGREGVGKTTLVANIGAALVEAGFAVELEDPASLKLRADADTPQVTTTIEPVHSSRRSHPDYVLHDVSGDNSPAALHEVMGAVAMCRLFVVTSADLKALQAANDAFAFLEQYNDGRSVPVPMGGMIFNDIASSFEEAFVTDFAHHVNARIIGKVPRSLVVRQCELYGSTVIESQGRSNQSYYYRRLAHQIVDATRAIYSGNLPQPLSAERLRDWSLAWAERIYALENGLVTDGAAI